MTPRGRYLPFRRNAPLPILDSIGPTPDIGTEVVRHVWYRRIDRPRNGHLGWVRCELRCRLILDWIEVRRTARSGRLVLRFPGQRSVAFGYRWYCAPLDHVAHRQFEDEVFRHLGLHRETS